MRLVTIVQHTLDSLLQQICLHVRRFLCREILCHIITPQWLNRQTKISTHLHHPKNCELPPRGTTTGFSTCTMMVDMCHDMHIHSCACPQEDIVLTGTHPTKNLRHSNQISREFKYFFIYSPNCCYCYEATTMNTIRSGSISLITRSLTWESGTGAGPYAGKLLIPST
jgi:hypothetical protein